jgi:hypothetical protein
MNDKLNGVLVIHKFLPLIADDLLVKKKRKLFSTTGNVDDLIE